MVRNRITILLKSIFFLIFIISFALVNFYFRNCRKKLGENRIDRGREIQRDKEILKEIYRYRETNLKIERKTKTDR